MSDKPTYKIDQNVVRILVGVGFILLGILFLVGRSVGAWFDIDFGHYNWPFFIIAPGVFLFIASFAFERRAGIILAIVGGMVVARKGSGKNPLRTLFLANIAIWSICFVFTLQASIVLLAIGMFVWLCLIPAVEAAEQTILQKVVPPERQGRVFGFAQSVEQSASPITAFLIGPVAQLIFIIHFMTTGAGVDLIGPWFGTDIDRGLALLFTVAGMIGLMVTLFAMRSYSYRALSERYESEAQEPEIAEPSIA